MPIEREDRGPETCSIPDMVCDGVAYFAVAKRRIQIVVVGVNGPSVMLG